MRQVFSSPRLENVEGVARLLREAGIEVRISNGRSYRSGWSGRRSYREGAGGPQASVWVSRSEDQPKARALLREAGLLLDTTMPVDSYLPEPALQRAERPGIGAGSRATRIKIGLLVAIALVIALSLMRAPQVVEPAAPDLAPAPAAAPTVEPLAPAVEPWRLPVPTALAALLLAREIEAAGNRAACVAVDGADPPPAVLQALAAPGRDILPASACDAAAGDRLRVDVHDYRTDGSGRGTVRSARAGNGGDRQSRSYATEREGDAWTATALP
ncbi:MAG: hypothetical protein ACLGHW_04245 [Gammaproteobacteria bacterium]